MRFVSFKRCVRVVFLLEFCCFRYSVFFPEGFTTITSGTFGDPDISFYPLLSTEVATP